MLKCDRGGDGEVADVERGDLDVLCRSEPLSLVLPNTPARYVEVDWLP
jgi:hypothetical protein